MSIPLKRGRHAACAGLAAAVAVFSSAPAAQTCPGGAAVQPRLIVPLFQYLPTDPASTSQFELFRSVLSTKLSALADEASAALSPSGASPAEFPGRLELYLRKGRPLEDTLEDPAQRRLYWDKSNSLELLRGRVWLGTSGKPHVVQSDIYIGDLRGAFPRSDVVVKLAIDPDEVSTTNDSHSVVTYFALAMEARRLGCDQAISRNLLARAKSILQDIRRRAGALPGDLAVLEKVIEEDLGK